MASEQPPSDASLESYRPIEFRSTSEEAAVGALMGCLTGSMAALLMGGLVGAMGAKLAYLCDLSPALGGSVFVWLAYWLLPLALLMKLRPFWLYLALAAAGAAWLFLLQWHIHQRDLGVFYPWILTALPFGIVLGAFFEPIRLARGGSTESYADKGWTVAGGFIAYGNRSALFLSAGYILGFVADLISFGHQRIGATIGGLLGGAATALAASAVLAWRGDDNVADLFFGSAWNIAWAGMTFGALAGAVSGAWAALMRERQEQQHQRLRDVD